MAEEQVTAVEEQSQPSEQTATSEPVETSWRDSLPDDLKANASLEKFSDVSTLAKSYINAEQMIGKDKMVVPGDNTTEDEWNDIYNKLGRPEEPDGYELQMNLQEGEAVDEQLYAAFKNAAHANGLSPKQAQGLLNFYNDISTEALNEQSNAGVLAQEQSSRELREEWGRNYETNLNAASNVAKQFLGEEVFQIELSDGSLLGDNATLIRGLSKIASIVSEDTLVGDKNDVVSNAGIQEQLNSLTAQGTAYWNKQDPNHDATVKKVLDLRELLTQ
tara:strand:+ start:1483 stop:2307 length:825 start_codon:yes stop_codon:yes gene_type:complete